MKRRANFHCHSTFSDGVNTLEEMVLWALEHEFEALGFTEHGYASYDTIVCIDREDIPEYMRQVNQLKERYRGRIELYLGVESEYMESTSKDGLDFTIGSSHYLHSEDGAEHYALDYKPELFEAARDRIAGGDVRRMVEQYYRQVTDMAQSYQPDIIGHLDLITKLNGEGAYFDEDAAWYRELCGDVARKIKDSGCIVELNTGGISRGYRKEPYPSRQFLELFYELGAPVMLNSDAHSADRLDFWFDEGEALLREIGFRSVMQLQGGRFVDVEL